MISRLNVLIPPGSESNNKREEVIRKVENSLNLIRECLSWCAIYTSSYGLDSNGLDLNVDLINVIKGTYEYFNIIHVFCLEISPTGLADLRANYYVSRIAKLEPFIVNIHSLMYKWAVNNSLSSQLQDFHSRRFLDHFSQGLSFSLELLVKESLLSSAFLPSLPVNNQGAIIAIDHYFNASRCFSTSEIEFFWNKNFSNSFHVSSDTFMNCLETYLNHHISKNDKETILATLDACVTNLINIAVLNDFIRVFSSHPTFSIKIAIDNLILLSKFTWFSGFMGREMANSILLHQSIGTFLIRFSSSRPTDFALNYVSSENVVKSHAIVSVEGKGFFLGNHTYTSLVELVTCNSTILLKPVLSRIGYLKYFYGFIDYEESKNLLLHHQVGTYLMRFSHSKPGCVVIAWVAKKGDVKQSIIGIDSKTGGYVLGVGSESEYFRSLDDIIDKMHDVLKYPCSFGSATSEGLNYGNNSSSSNFNLSLNSITSSPVPMTPGVVDSRGYSLRVTHSSTPTGGDESESTHTRHHHSNTDGGDEEGNFAVKKAQALSSDISNSGPRLRSEDSNSEPHGSSAKKIARIESSKSPYGCAVCLNAGIEIMFMPCKHTSCETCSYSLSACPICRSKIDQKIKFYLSS